MGRRRKGWGLFQKKAKGGRVSSIKEGGGRRGRGRRAILGKWGCVRGSGGGGGDEVDLRIQ